MTLNLLIKFFSNSPEDDALNKDFFINEVLSMNGVKGLDTLDFNKSNKLCGCKIYYKPFYRRIVLNKLNKIHCMTYLIVKE